MTTRHPHESDLHKPLLFQKVGVFIDAENIELSGLKHHGSRTDYRKILEKVGDREIIRILYYKPIYKEISATFQSFWKSLGGEIKQPSKNADSFLIIDAVTLADKMDVAIILGGDKDYLPLVWYLKSRGCRVEIWSWPEATSPEVKEAADVYFPLTLGYIVQSETASQDSRNEAPADLPKRESAVQQAPKPAPRSVAPRPPARPAQAPVPPAAETQKPAEAAADPIASPESDAKPVKKRRRGSRGGRRRSGRATKASDNAPDGAVPNDDDGPPDGDDV